MFLVETLRTPIPQMFHVETHWVTMEISITHINQHLKNVMQVEEVPLLEEEETETTTNHGWSLRKKIKGQVQALMQSIAIQMELVPTLTLSTWLKKIYLWQTQMFNLTTSLSLRKQRNCCKKQSCSPSWCLTILEASEDPGRAYACLVHQGQVRRCSLKPSPLRERPGFSMCQHQVLDQSGRVKVRNLSESSSTLLASTHQAPSSLTRLMPLQAREEDQVSTRLPEE